MAELHKSLLPLVAVRHRDVLCGETRNRPVGTFGAYPLEVREARAQKGSDGATALTRDRRRDEKELRGLI